VQEGDGIAQLFQVADDVGGDEDGVLLVPGKIQQQVGHLVPHHRVQPVGGFVQQQQLGMVRQRHRDAQFHLHAGGVILILLFIRQAELLAQLCISGSVPVAVDARHHLARLHRVQAQGDALAAQHHADLLFGTDGSSAAVPAKNGHGAAVPLHHVQNQPDGGAFARPVFADQPADGAPGQGQIQRPKSKVLIVLCKPLQFQCVHIQPSHSSSSISRSSSLLSPQDADRRTASVRCSSIFFRFSSRSNSVFFGATKKPFAGTA
jgi:hypothetical protein